MLEPRDGANSREEYEKTLAYAKERNYRAMYFAMEEDGYSADVDWKSLRHEEEVGDAKP